VTRKAARLFRKHADSRATKEALQGKIRQTMHSFLEPAEQILCPPAPGSFLPWTALIEDKPGRVTLRIAALPLAFLFAQAHGIGADFVVTDSRLIVMRGGHRAGIKTIPTAEILLATAQRHAQTANAPGYGGRHVEFVEISITFRQHAPVRLRFRHPWLNEGEAIAAAINHRSRR
jgi:hypothetical protein